MITIKGIDPNMIANNLEPFEPTHPGEVLKDEIEYRGISQKQLATEMGVSYTILNDIANSKRAISTEYALLLEATFWLNMQADFNLITVKRNPSFMERLKKVHRVASVL